MGDACPLAVGRYFRNVKNGPSPQWLQERLIAIGLRPISALVDITNYVTYDLNRPLHVFDADKVKGIPTMRMARAGEKVLALDGFEYELEPGMVVIADDERSRRSAASWAASSPALRRDQTATCSWNRPCSTRSSTARTGRKLGIISDARYRFERGVDPEFVDSGHRDRREADPGIVRRRGEPRDPRRRAARLAPHRRFPPQPGGDLGGVSVPRRGRESSFPTLGFGVAEPDARR